MLAGLVLFAILGKDPIEAMRIIFLKPLSTLCAASRS